MKVEAGGRLLWGGCDRGAVGRTCRSWECGTGRTEAKPSLLVTLDAVDYALIPLH